MFEVRWYGHILRMRVEVLTSVKMCVVGLVGCNARLGNLENGGRMFF
jgi:hypothetical protein